VAIARLNPDIPPETRDDALRRVLHVATASLVQSNRVDEEFDEITKAEEASRCEQLQSKWAALEALVGEPKRSLHYLGP
jgi:tRNA nucleotidyltransferase/poly(A) polymerase